MRRVTSRFGLNRQGVKPHLEPATTVEEPSLSATATAYAKLGIGGGGKEFPAAVPAAEEGCLSIACGVESGGGIDGRAAGGVDCFGSGCIHGFVPFLVVISG